MKTLLEKVQTIESQASTLIEEARESGSAKVQTLKDQEEGMITDIQHGAELKSKNIIQEHLQAVQQEINSIRQESKQSMEKVHEAAQKNRKRAVSKALSVLENSI